MFACDGFQKLNDWLIYGTPARRFPPPWTVEDIGAPRGNALAVFRALRG